MKKAFLVIAVAAFSFALPSCKKCSTCEWTVSGTTTPLGEACGKKKDVDAWEDACKATASLGGGTCTCKKS